MICKNGFKIAAAALGLAWAGLASAGMCPAQSSGKAGVDAWWAANSGACDNPATTCNGEFTIEFLGRDVDGYLVTFNYEICQIAGQNQNALGHWVLGLGQIDCLDSGFTLPDLVVGAMLNWSPISDYVVNLDPTTQVYGLNFNQGVAWHTCNQFSVTFDTSLLDEGYTLGVGCVLAATKAGNQDIRRNTNRATPGYASILGPVCVPIEECWEEETAWSDGQRYQMPGNWATYTAYNGEAQTVVLYAGADQMEAGEVYFSAPYMNGDVRIVITLSEGWRFQDVIENVKIQDYAFAPSGNPSPGQFDHKGDAYPATDTFAIFVPGNDFYGVHVDVERRVTCED